MKSIFPSHLYLVVLLAASCAHGLAQEGGEFRFAAPQTVSAVQTSFSLAVADFNGDGQSDLILSNMNTNLVSVFLSSGRGTLLPSSNLEAANSTVPVVVGDFNGDLKPDFVVGHFGTNLASTFLGNGDGTFQPAVNSATALAFSLAAGDFNQDGKLDLVTAWSGVRVHLGNGDGTFVKALLSLDPVVANAIAAVVGDVNGDGKLDVVTANGGTASLGRISVIPGNGDGTFGDPAYYTSVGANAISVALADFNGDTRPDIVVANEGSDDASVYLNNGDGTFGEALVVPTLGEDPGGVATGDFDRDNRMDFVISHTKSGSLSIFKGNGNGTFQGPIVYRLGSILTDVRVGDFDGDGVPDLAASANDLANGIHGWILTGNGDGTFQVAPHHPTGEGAREVKAVDLNGDGRSDLVVANVTANNISVLLNNGDGSFLLSSNYFTGKNPSMIAAADFTGDLIPDLAVANQNTNVISLLVGNGDGTFLGSTGVVSITIGTSSVLSGDYNNDSRTDLLIAGLFGATVYPGNNDGTFATGISTSGPFLADIFRQGHLNNDTFPDLVFVRQVTNVTVMLGKADGTFFPPVNYVATTNVQEVTVVDLNGDDRDDLAVASLGCTTCGAAVPSGDISVLINNGDGTFQPAVKYMAGTRPQGITAGDFNGDGKIDLASGEFGVARISVLPGNGDGTFGAPQTFGVLTSSRWLTADDLNGDDRPDLAVINSGDDSVSIMLNTRTAPPLTISYSNNGTSMSVAWPATATGFVLEQADSPDAIIWEDVTEAVVEENGVLTVTILYTGTGRYFRLSGNR